MSLTYKSKIIEGEEVRLLYMSLSRCPCADFHEGSRKSTNSVRNINTAKSLQKSRNNLLADEKGPQQGYPGSCLVIHIYFRFIATRIK